MDVGPVGASLCSEVTRRDIVVLRSFGKFFGLAALRLGLALAKPEIAARLAAALGPWAVSGPHPSTLAVTVWAILSKCRGQSAVDRNLLAGNIGAGFRGEQDGQAGKFAGLAPAS